ncbi:MAG: tetratricopeptide repeat protein [Pseudanabaenales cyanobacterium]|nr:tetratricopeptide repeat protein [Pseudanabaenales cyanobacterium]
MTPADLSQALNHYQAALSDWSRRRADVPRGAVEQQGLTVLRAREALQAALERSPIPDVYSLRRLQWLDHFLLLQANALARVVDFRRYRQSLFPPADHWWWRLDSHLPRHRQDRCDWLFRGAGVLLWTVGLGLLGDISRRFFLGGPGVAGVSAIAFSGLLTLLNARSELTAAGRAGFDHLLESLRVPQKWQYEAKLGATGLLSMFLLSFWLSLPTLSNLYNQWGNRAGRLGSAVQNYQRAIGLNPDNVDAHYNIGVLYEDLQQLEQAETHYRIAMQGNVPEAYNNLGRLYLQPPDPNPAAAVVLLSVGLELTESQEKALKEDNSFFATRYTLFKNLGWARLHQARYPDAERPLKAAIGILQRPEAEAQISNPASAHCLLAQVLEAQGDETALASWRSCYQLGRSANLDEDTWMFQACQRLKEKNLPCPHP